MRRVIVEYLSDTIELPVGETVVGREITCQLRFNDSAVSRRHARIVVGPGWVTVEDLGSTNGTTLNGHALSYPRQVVDGDVVRIGGRTLKFRLLAARERLSTVDRTDGQLIGHHVQERGYPRLVLARRRHVDHEHDSAVRRARPAQ